MGNNLAGDYYLTQDVDCSDTVNWDSAAGFEPVGDYSSKFTGSFDGRNFTISDLFINRGSTNYVGLFGFTDGSGISNVGLVDVNVTGNGQVGGLVGYNLGTIDSCYVTGIITAKGTVGGVVGYNGGPGAGIISNCYSTATVNITLSVVGGGFVGDNYGGEIVNSYAIGNVFSVSKYAGGFAGNHFYQDINNSFATGDVSSNGSNYGGLVGLNDFGNLHNSYWNNKSGNPSVCVGEVWGDSIDCTAVADNVAYFFSSSNEPLASWDFSSVWHERPKDYPVLAWEFNVTNVSACLNITSFGTYRLVQNISASGTCFNITVDDVVLDGNGFAVTGPGSGEVYGVTAHDVVSVTVKNFANIKSFKRGINFEDVNSSVIEDNNLSSTFAATTYGIYLADASFNRIEDNVLDWNSTETSSFAYGIYFSVSSGVASGSNNITNNTLRICSTDYTAAGIFVGNDGESCNSNVIQGNSISVNASGNGAGLELYTPLFNAIESTVIKENDFSIHSENGSAYGVYLHNSYGNSMNYTVIQGNNFTVFSSKPQVTSIYSYGILFDNVESVNASGNFINSTHLGNSSTGIMFNLGSDYNTLWDNTVFEGNYSIYLELGGGTGNVFYNSNLSGAVNEEIYDKTGNSNLNHFLYNSSFGEVRWIDLADDGFLKNLTTEGTLTFGGTINISDNLVSINTGGFSNSKINSSVNVTLYGMSVYSFATPGILRNGVLCNEGKDPACVNLTAFDADTFVFNTTGLSTYSLGESGPTNITNCTRLQDMKDYLSVNIQLLNNIDCSDTVNWNGGAGFAPIGNSTHPFTGQFNGRGFRVTDLHINRPSTYNIGLFGMAENANISNAWLVNVNVTGKNSVGGLLGYANRNVTIRNSSTTGFVNGSATVGGLVGGEYQNALIERCYSTADVYGTSTGVGGLVGTHYMGNISNCYAAGKVNTTNDYAGYYAGGLVGAFGYYEGEAWLTDSYATGFVDAYGYAGGLVGQAYSAATVTVINNSFATGNVSSSYDTGGLIGQQDSGAILDDSYWNNNSGNPSACVGSDSGSTDCTAVADNEAYFYSSSNTPLSTWDFTNTWSEMAGDYPKLHWQPNFIYDCTNLQNMKNDLMADYYLMNDVDCSDTANWNGGAGFEPVGDSTTKFSGTFDGRNFTISSLFINRSSEDVVGLFGEVDGVSIVNVGLLDVNITGRSNVGSLVGVGDFDMFRCYAEGSVYGVGSHLYYGGLIGMTESVSNISDCHADVDVNAHRYSGGLVGYNTGPISDSYAVGDVIAGLGSAGGLVGINDGGITNCYATGSVNDNVSGVGGLVGDQYSTITNSHWNNNSGNPSECYDGGNTGCTAIADNEPYFYDSSNEPLASWDFPSVWFERRSDFPILRWQDYTPETTARIDCSLRVPIYSGTQCSEDDAPCVNSSAGNCSVDAACIGGTDPCGISCNPKNQCGLPGGDQWQSVYFPGVRYDACGGGSRQVWLAYGNGTVMGQGDSDSNEFTERDGIRSVTLYVKNFNSTLNATDVFVYLSNYTFDSDDVRSSVVGGGGHEVGKISNLGPNEMFNLTVNFILSQYDGYSFDVAYAIKVCGNLTYDMNDPVDWTGWTPNPGSDGKGAVTYTPPTCESSNYDFSITPATWDITLSDTSNANTICSEVKKVFTIQNNGSNTVSNIVVSAFGGLSNLTHFIPDFSGISLEPGEKVNFTAYVLVNNGTGSASVSLNISGTCVSTKTVDVTYTEPGTSWTAGGSISGVFSQSVTSNLCGGCPKLSFPFLIPTGINASLITNPQLKIAFPCSSCDSGGTKILYQLNSDFSGCGPDSTSRYVFEYTGWNAPDCTTVTQNIPANILETQVQGTLDPGCAETWACTASVNPKPYNNVLWVSTDQTRKGHFCTQPTITLTFNYGPTPTTLTDTNPDCILCTTSYTSETQGSCSDGSDDDCDGLIDCDDLDCCTTSNSTGCKGASTVCPLPENWSDATCEDGVDNDGDGLADCRDSDCCTLSACSSTSFCAGSNYISGYPQSKGINFNNSNLVVGGKLVPNRFGGLPFGVNVSGMRNIRDSLRVSGLAGTWQITLFNGSSSQDVIVSWLHNFSSQGSINLSQGAFFACGPSWVSAQGFNSQSGVNATYYVPKWDGDCLNLSECSTGMFGCISGGSPVDSSRIDETLSSDFCVVSDVSGGVVENLNASGGWWGGNSPPQLNNPVVSPNKGKSSTVFNFSVNYSDADNDYPFIIEVLIGNRHYPLVEADTSDINYTDGKIFFWNGTLRSRSYNISFFAIDGKSFYDATGTATAALGYNPTNNSISPFNLTVYPEVDFTVNWNYFSSPVQMETPTLAGLNVSDNCSLMVVWNPKTGQFDDASTIGSKSYWVWCNANKTAVFEGEEVSESTFSFTADTACSGDNCWEPLPWKSLNTCSIEDSFRDDCDEDWAALAVWNSTQQNFSYVTKSSAAFQYMFPTFGYYIKKPNGIDKIDMCGGDGSGGWSYNSWEPYDGEWSQCWEGGTHVDCWGGFDYF